MTEEKIVVEKSQLDALLEEQRVMKEKMVMLESIADKTQLAKFYEKMQDKDKRSFRLRVLRNDNGEKLVVKSWGPMVTNEVFQNAQGVSVAKQVVKVQLENDSEVVGELLDMGRRYEFIQTEKVETIKSYKDDNGAEWDILKLKAENGKTYEIDSHFVN